MEDSVLRLLYGRNAMREIIRDGRKDMAIVLTNGTFYVYYKENNAIRKTTDINEANDFGSVTKAVEVIKKAYKKTDGYFVYDTIQEKVRWRKYNRKQYSPSVRKIVYANADGCCQLCGKKITYNEMTLDHIIPLAMGGKDSEENLQCTCRACNKFKDNILPELFMEKISEIFLYQMQKKYDDNLGWKILHNILVKMV